MALGALAVVQCVLHFVFVGVICKFIHVDIDVVHWMLPYDLHLRDTEPLQLLEVNVQVLYFVQPVLDRHVPRHPNHAFPVPPSHLLVRQFDLDFVLSI